MRRGRGERQQASKQASSALAFRTKQGTSRAESSFSGFSVGTDFGRFDEQRGDGERQSSPSRGQAADLSADLCRGHGGAA